MKTKIANVGTKILAFAAVAVGAAGLARGAAAQDKFEVVPYGRVKFDASYDAQRTSPGDWAGWVLPQTGGKDDDELNATARDSRIGLRVRAPDYNGLATTGLVELDFLSSGPANSLNPRLRLAYFDVAAPNGWALRAGQDWDLFGIYHPNTVDPGLLGNAGNPRGFRPQIRVTRSFQLSESTKLVAAVAATRNIGQDLDGAGQDDGADSGTPAVQAGLALHAKGAAGRPLTLAVAGLYGRETVDGVEKSATTNAFGSVAESVRIVDPDAKDYDSWLAHVALVLPLTARLTAQGVAWAGANLDAYQVGIGQGVNAAAGKEIRARGGYAQLSAKAAEKLTLGLGYGVDDPEDGDLPKGARARNARAYGNAIYALTPATSLGFEVSHLETKYKEGDTADSIRVALSGTLRF